MPRTNRAVRSFHRNRSDEPRPGLLHSRVLALAALGVACGAPQTARANDFLWDANGATAGEGGGGNWTTAGVNWFGDHDGDGNASFVAWPNTLTDSRTDAIALF